MTNQQPRNRLGSCLHHSNLISWQPSNLVIIPTTPGCIHYDHNGTPITHSFALQCFQQHILSFTLNIYNICKRPLLPQSLPHILSRVEASGPSNLWTRSARSSSLFLSQYQRFTKIKMSNKLPKTKKDWREAATRNKIGHTQSLSNGTPLPSGSKFTFEHFLRLRVVYIDEKSPASLVRSRGFPTERLEAVTTILKENTDASFLKNFLRRPKDIEERWNAHNAKQSGVFAVALELLHLISKRKVEFMTESEDISDLKIVSSPLKELRKAQSDARYLNSSSYPSTPLRVPPKSYYISPFNDFSKLSIDSPGEQMSEAGADLRRAIYSYERSNFTPGDEQTVNAALVALIMAMSWLLGRTGRAHHDRARFSVCKDDENYLYSACVDGLIMHLDRDTCNGFMEVKPDFRAGNASVRRQITAQMAAFIFEQEIVLARGEPEEKTEKSFKGKGKQAKAKAQDDRITRDDGGDQDKRFRKWMVSMDGYYAYINIATYDRQYLEFLSGSEPSGTDALMEMAEYGRFDLRLWSGNGLERFLKYVGALMLDPADP